MARLSPIFIVSAPRSGSTLLRLIVNAHSNIVVPSPTWLFEMIYPYLYSYGNLGDENNLLSLAEDIVAAPTIKRWPFTIEPAKLIAEAKVKSFEGMYEALHVMYARRENKARWGEKSPRDSFWMDEIHALFPDAQFVHIIRDGRDMAIDISDSLPMFPYTVYSGALLWQRYVHAIRDSAGRLPSSAYTEIRYEELCKAPEPTIQRLCEFLGEKFDSAMLAPNQTKSAQQWSTHSNHAKIAEPISTRYCEMYRSRLPESDVAALNAVIGQSLKLFGYPVETAPSPIAKRLAAQLVESDTVTSMEYAGYRMWHDKRRRERRDAGIWKSSDRRSFLLAMN